MNSASIAIKQCASCHKTGGILTCDGCQQAFCGKHAVEHRQELTIQLENIMQEHDCIRQDISLRLNNHLSYQQIDQWEKESIARIQVAAEKTRTNVRRILESSNDRISTLCQGIATKLRTAREAENFSEIDLTRWMKQLDELKLQMKSDAIIHIPEDSTSAVQFIRIRQGNVANIITTNNNLSSSKTLLSSRTEERFNEVNGLATIDDSNLRIKHADNDLKFVYCRGQQLYSQGRHTTRFKIEQGSGSYNIFIGICSSSIGLRQIIYNLAVVAGWFSNSEVWLHGRCNNNNTSKVNGYRNDDIKINDIFELTIDCDKKQIELFHDRTNKRQMINVDPVKAPFPWHILLALRRRGDCVRILPNS